MRKKNSATAALIPSRWRKISKRKKRKKNPACRLPQRSSRNPCPFPRLPRPSPGPHHPLRAVAAASPKRKRKLPKRNRLRKRRRRRLPKNPPRKKLQRNQRRKLRRRNPRRKARSAVKPAAGREHLPSAKAWNRARNRARFFSCLKPLSSFGPHSLRASG